MCILNSLNVNRDKTEKLMKTKTHFGGGIVNVSKTRWFGILWSQNVVVGWLSYNVSKMSENEVKLWKYPKQIISKGLIVSL